MMLRSFARSAGSLRAMSTKAAATPTINIDWNLIRSKMLTDEGRAEADKAREVFQRRLTAAHATPEPLKVDFESYRALLPDIDIDALKADYQKFFSAVPPLVYEEGADKAAHESKEASWGGFAAFCKARVVELEKLAAEQKEHKLHRFYRRARVWQRFPGLYESLHHRARGTWDNDMWAAYISYRARLTPLPWEPTVGDVDESKRKAILEDVAAKSGIPAETVIAAVSGKKA